MMTHYDAILDPVMMTQYDAIPDPVMMTHDKSIIMSHQNNWNKVVLKNVLKNENEENRYKIKKAPPPGGV